MTGGSLFAVESKAAEASKDDGANLLVMGAMTIIVVLVAWLAIRYMRGWSRK